MNNQLTIAVIGQSGVGKSAIINQLINKQFSEKYNQTVEDKYKTSLLVDRYIQTFEIIDCSGNEEFKQMRERVIEEADGVILVYSVDSSLSFFEIAKYRHQILKTKNDINIPIILVGNKIDRIEEREITNKQGRELARQFHCPFIEISAQFAVDQVFIDLLRDMNCFYVERKKATKRQSLNQIFSSVHASKNVTNPPFYAKSHKKANSCLIMQNFYFEDPSITVW